MNHVRQTSFQGGAILHLSIVAMLLIPISGCSVVEFLLSERIHHISISPSGNEVAFLQFPNHVKVRSLDDEGEDLCQLRVPLTSGEVHFAFHGMLLAVDQPETVDLFAVDDVNRTVAIYDVSVCELVRESPLPGLQTTTSLAFSSDGNFILRSSQQSSASEVQLHLIDAESGESIEQWSYPNSHPISFALSGDDSLVLIGLAQHKNPNDEGEVPLDHIGKAVLMRMPTGEVVREWVESETVGIRAVAISPDGTRIALKLYDGSLKVTHLPTGESQILLTPAQDVEDRLSASPYEKLLFSPNGSVLFEQSVLHAGRLYAFLVDSGEPLKEFVYEAVIGDFEISSDGKRLVVGTEAGEIKTEDLGLLIESG